MPKKTPNYIVLMKYVNKLMHELFLRHTKSRNTIVKRWEWCWLQSWQGQVAFWSAWLGIFYNIMLPSASKSHTLAIQSGPLWTRTSALRLLRFWTHWCTVSCQMIPLQHCSHYMPGHKVGKTIVWHVSLSTSSGAWRSEVTITVKNALMQLMLIILAASPIKKGKAKWCLQAEPSFV